MKLTCPSCGAVASVEAWENDMDARKTLQAIVKLPHEVAVEIFGYLTLFRPSSRSLSWKVALRTVQDLAAMVASGYVQVQGKPTRPCPASIWAHGMRQMVAQRETLARPMKNHNYLLRVAWQLADKLDADLEFRRRREDQDGTTRSHHEQEQHEQIILTEAEKQTLATLGIDKSIKKLDAHLSRRKEEK